MFMVTTQRYDRHPSILWNSRFCTVMMLQFIQFILYSLYTYATHVIKLFTTLYNDTWLVTFRSPHNRSCRVNREFAIHVAHVTSEWLSLNCSNDVFFSFFFFVFMCLAIVLSELFLFSQYVGEFSMLIRLLLDGLQGLLVYSCPHSDSAGRSSAAWWEVGRQGDYNVFLSVPCL